MARTAHPATGDAAPMLRPGQPAATLSAMPWRALAATVLLAAAALRPSSAWAVAEGSPPIVTYRSDRLSVRLEKVPLEEVLAELGRVSGAEIHGAPREPRAITAQFDDVPLLEALFRLIGDQNFMLSYGEGDRLRTIELFGGPQEPRDATSTSPATGSVGSPSPAAGSTMPQNLAVAISLLERHPPVAVTGRLAAKLGGNTATFHQIFDVALHEQDAGLRTEALRVSLKAFEAESDLLSRVLTLLAGVDDAVLGQALRAIAGSHAEEIAHEVAGQAQAGEVRAKAMSVLQRLRTITSPGG